MSTICLEQKLCENFIRFVARENCFLKSCIEDFSHEAVKVVQTKMWFTDYALRKYMKLQVHRNAYKVDGHKVISLEGQEIYLIAWSIIYSISGADIYRIKGFSMNGMRTKKRQIATWQACASLSAVIEGAADLMLYKFHKLPNRECVVEHILLSRTKWKDLQYCINEVLFLLPVYYIYFDGFKVATLTPLCHC
jgi:hypothetical protein